MNGYTPGPWTTFEGFVVDCDGRQIASIYARRMESFTDANARLIAAAPDLLEALVACVALIEKEIADSEYVWQSNVAKMAIAKAKGEA